ncbi:hypothetical protein A33K_18556 [Burkholderia humptydooensis MSMB43]|uniref:Uncharacterized protein n=1 Tax=Burkholderia humptydooensis MSMB43 TaxID=441157 RepID=A0ABN0FXL2_9BURK|nr:hypothetical protein A33K_18556 [Burkholderia humptydooensis MSMB43]
MGVSFGVGMTPLAAVDTRFIGVVHAACVRVRADFSKRADDAVRRVER